MNKQKIWIASGIAAGLAAAAFILVKKYRKNNEVEGNNENVNGLQPLQIHQPSRHITNVFAKTKHQPL